MVQDPPHNRGVGEVGQFTCRSDIRSRITHLVGVHYDQRIALTANHPGHRIPPQERQEARRLHQAGRAAQLSFPAHLIWRAGQDHRREQLSGTVAEAIYKKLCRLAGGSRVSITAIKKLDDSALPFTFVNVKSCKDREKAYQDYCSRRRLISFRIASVFLRRSVISSLRAVTLSEMKPIRKRLIPTPISSITRYRSVRLP